MYDRNSYEPLPYNSDPEFNKPKKTKIWKGIFALMLVAAVSVGSIMGYRYVTGQPDNGATPQSYLQDQNAPQSGGNGNVTNAVFPPTVKSTEALTTAEVYKKASSWVVAIETYGTVSNPFTGASNESPLGVGTGIVYSSDGYILTNEHVISGATRVVVLMNDGTEYEAKLIGSDEKTDIAVVKVEATGLAAAEFGDSTALLPGDTAIVIGNPLGTFADTITQGIISSTERELQLERYIMNLIQVDAAINPGNSGGPLLNTYGQVVGVVNAKIAATNVEGIGFAIPTATALTIANDLIEYGYVASRPVLGISVVTYTEELGQMYGHAAGVFVQEVYAGSAAEEAGLKVGDKVLKFNGQTLADGNELTYKVSRLKVGDKVVVTVQRDGAEKDITVTLKATKQ